MFSLVAAVLSVTGSAACVCSTEAKAYTGCTTGKFYTPQTGTTAGVCAACTSPTIASGVSPFTVSCDSSTGKSKLVSSGVEATTYTGCTTGNFYTPATSSADGKCTACTLIAIPSITTATGTVTSCDSSSGKSKVILASGVEATTYTGCTTGKFYTPATSSADGKCTACTLTAIPSITATAGAITSCDSSSGKSKVILANGLEATTHTGCTTGKFYTPATSSADGKCGDCDPATISGSGGDTVSCDSATKGLTKVIIGTESTCTSTELAACHPSTTTTTDSAIAIVSEYLLLIPLLALNELA